MKIIVDVNIIISCLIKNSITRKIIKESGFDFYFPDLSFNKIMKYKDYIIKKSSLSEGEFYRLMATMLQYIKLIPSSAIITNWTKAKEIMEKVDEEDVAFIAAALAIKDSIIWSDDKHFEKQSAIKIIKTKELINY